MVRVWMGGDRGEDVEDLLPLQEERPQLGIEERKPLIHVDLGQIRLDLRKVRIDRKVGGQIRRDAVLQVESRLRHVVLDERSRGVERSGAQGGHRRQDLQVAAGREIRQPFQYSHLGQELRDVPGKRRPDDRLVLALDGARNLETPAVGLALVHCRVPQALERNRHLRRPAVVRRRAGRDEERIPGDVAFGNAARRRSRRAAAPRPYGPALSPVAQAGRVQNGVPLHAEAVHRELVRALPVAERVEEQRDGVVLRDLVAIRAVGPHEAGIGVARTDADVEVLAVVGDVHLGRLAGGGPLDRRRLHEGGEPGRAAPGFVVEQPVDDRRLLDPDGCHHRLAGSVRRRPGQQQRQDRSDTGGVRGRKQPGLQFHGSSPPAPGSSGASRSAGQGVYQMGQNRTPNVTCDIRPPRSISSSRKPFSRPTTPVAWWYCNSTPMDHASPIGTRTPPRMIPPGSAPVAT